MAHSVAFVKLILLADERPVHGPRSDLDLDIGRKQWMSTSSAGGCWITDTKAAVGTQEGLVPRGGETVRR